MLKTLNQTSGNKSLTTCLQLWSKVRGQDGRQGRKTKPQNEFPSCSHQKLVHLIYPSCFGLHQQGEKPTLRNPPWLETATGNITSQLQQEIFQGCISTPLMAQIFLHLLSSTNIFHSPGWSILFQTCFHHREQSWNAKPSPLVGAVAGMHWVALKQHRPSWLKQMWSLNALINIVTFKTSGKYSLQSQCK